MKPCISWLLAAALAGALPAHADNNDPIVLVHGFLGFGPDQFKDSGFLYWGGFNDVVAHLQAGGAHRALAATVSPVAANWDRAAELYYQIKGGCVDYGSTHSARYHRNGVQKPPGKCWAIDAAHNPAHYPLAFYPQWDAKHPIHLVGHSQGGTTIRALIELLENGSPDGDEGGADLYAGGKVGWVTSATTIASPHNGTTLRDAVLNFTPLMNEWMREISILAQPDAVGPVEPLSLAPALSDFETAQRELAPDGARIFNAWARTSPHVYYFSIGTRATEAGNYCCNDTDRLIAPIQKPAYQYPRLDMMFFFKPFAGEWVVPGRLQRGMGSYTQTAHGRVKVDSTWFPNDGVVNTVSMKAPSGHPMVKYDGYPRRGSWNFLRTYEGYDHFDILGWPGASAPPYPIYDEIAQIVYGL